MTATNALRKSLGVTLFIACPKPTAASITQVPLDLTGMKSIAPYKIVSSGQFSCCDDRLDAASGG
jgi:hypothetical protein